MEEGRSGGVEEGRRGGAEKGRSGGVRRAQPPDPACVTPKTAGMESTANTTSDNSMTARHSSSGVAVFTPSTSVKKFSPSYCSDTGNNLLTNFTMALSAMSSSSPSSSTMSL